MITLSLPIKKKELFNGYRTGGGFKKRESKMVKLSLTLTSNPRYKILNNQGYKFLVVKSHLIFYKGDQENKIVTIYRVLHNKSQYQSFLSISSISETIQLY